MTTLNETIESMLGYFQTHKNALEAARRAIIEGNASFASEILRVTIANIDVYVKKLEAIVV